jgi:hypothetical protein
VANDSQTSKSVNIAEYREIQKMGRFVGVGGEALGELLNEIERLQADLSEAVDVLKANARLWEGWNLLPGSVGGRTSALLARLSPETGVKHE